MTITSLFQTSPLGERLETSNGEAALWLVELRDLARAFCGGLIVALPLLYTMEMWHRARFMPPLDLLTVLVVAYFINVAACYFCGFKSRRRRVQPWWDAATAIGIGAIASLCTLLLIGRINPGTPAHVIVNIVTLELIPVSLGAALAMNQLGGSRCNDDEKWGTPDIRSVIATILGGILFAFNVAPTIEPKIILTTVSDWHILAIAVFSLLISWLMVDFAHFSDAEEEGGRILRSEAVETAVSYLISLLVSAGFLWTFGYIDTSTDLSTVVPWVVVLGYATTLGGSAGRLIL
ncbi:MAG: TIGR02587 family membrane protein [Gammaproteobacteria bacterium]|nr:TIGR02587 family membrane protein [Gammaproteobacteria bacterium]NND61398.1 TIGR02587 family membrane protein [Gammaproteobacteria bacterium]